MPQADKLLPYVAQNLLRKRRRWRGGGAAPPAYPGEAALPRNYPGEVAARAAWEKVTDGKVDAFNMLLSGCFIRNRL